MIPNIIPGLSGLSEQQICAIFDKIAELEQCNNLLVENQEILLNRIKELEKNSVEVNKFIYDYDLAFGEFTVQYTNQARKLDKITESLENLRLK